MTGDLFSQPPAKKPAVPSCEHCGRAPRIAADCKLIPSEIHGQVCNYSQEWKQECAASAVLRMPLEDRGIHLTKIGEKHGPRAEIELKNIVAKLHALRRGKK